MPGRRLCERYCFSRGHNNANLLEWDKESWSSEAYCSLLSHDQVLLARREQMHLQQGQSAAGRWSAVSWLSRRRPIRGGKGRHFHLLFSVFSLGSWLLHRLVLILKIRTFVTWAASGVFWTSLLKVWNSFWRLYFLFHAKFCRCDENRRGCTM